MKKILIILTLILLTLFSACGDSDLNDPRGSTAAPAQVTNVRVQNISGSSILFYDRPNDENLKYVQAAYTLADGTHRTFNASFYTDSILVNGFPEAGEYDVQLYSVSYGEAKSAPVTVKVNPSTPAYRMVLEKANVEPTFGGIRFTSEDEATSDLSIIFLKKNTINEWEEIGAYYTKKAPNLQHVVRGQEAVETEFGIYASDRWGYKSDTVYWTLTPWAEIEIPKTNPLWKKMELPGDTYVTHTWSGSKTSVEALWDGITNSWETVYHTKSTDPMPQSFSIDLGAPYIFSRIVCNWRTNGSWTNYTNFFTSGMPKTFEIWASNNPNGDGSWESWEFIESFVSLRADGTARSSTEIALTDADKEMLKTGHNFDFPVGVPAYRYIRFRTTSTYQVNSVQIAELTLFGQIPE